MYPGLISFLMPIFYFWLLKWLKFSTKKYEAIMTATDFFRFSIPKN